jgi:hypothetical protein
MMPFLIGSSVLLLFWILNALFNHWIFWRNRLKPGDRVYWKEEGLNGYGEPRTGHGYGVVLERAPNGTGNQSFYAIKLDGTGEEIGTERDELHKLHGEEA